MIPDAGTSALTRPVVFDYGSPVDFLKALLAFYKSTSTFSLRQRTQRAGALSQAMVSQILNGKRQLSRDHIPALVTIFKLTKIEQDFIDKQITRSLVTTAFDDAEKRPTVERTPKNHLLTNWLHPYVKDLVNLRGFDIEPTHLHRMLNGIASPEKIKRSTDFLLREGFWRRAQDGKIVPDEAAVATTNEIPNESIRTFHKKALDIAQRGITTLPSHRRKSSTVLLSVDKAKLDELRGLIDSFQQQLLDFLEKYPTGKDNLVQVSIHMTPVGSNHENK